MKCCELFSGKLRSMIAVEQAVGAPDGGGGESITWQPVATIRAYVKPISGGERYFANRIEADTTHRVFVRYRTDLNTAYRINLNGRLMQIRAILNVEEMNQWLEIYADEGKTT